MSLKPEKPVSPKPQKAFKNKTPKNFKPKKVSDIVLDEEEDPCAPKVEVEAEPQIMHTPGLDPRFQQQNQTMRCYVMYTDFYQCEHLLGEGAEACTWFKQVFTSICPQAWIQRWDEQREENIMPWFKRAPFPQAPYGKKAPKHDD